MKYQVAIAGATAEGVVSLEKNLKATGIDMQVDPSFQDSPSREF